MAVSLLTFLGVTVALLAAFHFLPRYLEADQRRVRQRLASEFRGEQAGPAQRALYRDTGVLDLDSAQEYALLGAKGAADSLLSLAGWRKYLEAQLRQAGAPFGVWGLLIVSLFLAATLALAGGWVLRWPGGFLGASVGLVLPTWIVHLRAKWMRDRFLAQLPGAFELMARVIRAGQSVPQSLQAVAEAFDEPLASEFSACQHQQDFGLAPEVVFQEMAQRSGILEVRIFVMAMAIQRQTGGHLADVLDRLAVLIRGRLRLRQQVRTLTAEGRLQGWTLVVLPILMFFVLYFLNRRYAETLLEHRNLLLATGGLMAVGILWIRRIVNFVDG